MAVGRVAAGLQTMRILWFALLCSHLILLFMIESHLVKPEAEEMPPHLPELLGALALGLAIVSIVLPARAIDQGLRTLEVQTTNEVGEAIGSFRESAPVRKVVADPERALIAALPRFQTPLILGLALAEAISLFGFVVGFFGAPAWQWTPFFAAGVLLTLVKFPRLEAMTRAIERVKGARCDLRLSGTSTNP